MVRTFIFMAMLGSMTLTTNAWWFWNTDDDDEDEVQPLVEQQQAEITRLQGVVDESQHAKDEWQIIAFVLGVGCVGSLVVGAAIGSRAGRASKGVQQ